MAMVPRMGRREQRWEEMKRRDSSPTLVVGGPEVTKVVASFKKKAVSRLKNFYTESQKMDEKLPQLLAEVSSRGFQIEKLTIKEYDRDSILNYRKKTKNITFDVVAKRDGYELNGTLLVTPASMRLTLNCSKLRQVTTKNGFGLPLLQASFYRTINIRDNYLASLVGGGRTIKEEVDETEEVPF